MKKVFAFVLCVAIILFSTLACCFALDVTVDGYISGDEWYGKEKTFYYPCETDGLIGVESLIIGADVNYNRNEVLSYFIAYIQNGTSPSFEQCGYIEVNSQKIVLFPGVNVSEAYTDFSVNVQWAEFTDSNQIGAEISVVFPSKIKKTAVDIRVQLCDRNGRWTEVYPVFSNIGGSASADESPSKANASSERSTAGATIKGTEKSVSVRSYGDNAREGENGEVGSVSGYSQADDKGVVSSVTDTGSNYSYFFGNSPASVLPKASKVKYAVGMSVSAALISVAIIFAASGAKKSAVGGVNSDEKQECEKGEGA